MPLPSCAQFMRSIVRDEKYLSHYFDFVRLLLPSSMKYTFRINKFQFSRCLLSTYVPVLAVCVSTCTYFIFARKASKFDCLLSILTHMCSWHMKTINSIWGRIKMNFYLLAGSFFSCLRNLMETLHGPGAGSEKKISKIIMSFFY